MIYFTLFLLGCISALSLSLYILGFILYLNHLDQAPPAIAFIPKEIFFFIPFVHFYKKKEVQEMIEKIEKILP